MIACLGVGWLPFTVAWGQPPPAAEFSSRQLEYFEKHVRPLLLDKCLKCHGQDPQQIRGGLRLTSRAAILRGGDSGPAAVAGDPQASLLIQAVRHEELEMPPEEKLSPEQIDALAYWIAIGLPDSRQDGITKPAPQQSVDEIDLDQGRRFWAFRPPQATAPPPVTDRHWPDSVIDHFILARLEAQGLHPVADASRETLIRRVHFALIGLPPDPQEIDRFVVDPSPDVDALARVVDRLLATEFFGQRWGRHWLDVARFAESSGGGRSLMFPNAWRYRDYVIDSFNNDKPFDQFVIEQIAGDLLPYDSDQQRAEQLIATGFLVLGPTNYEQQDKDLLRMEVIDEQIDTIGRALLGMTLGCARCHDHKFDPIPTSDYYALAGILGSTRTLIPGNVSGYVEQPLPRAQAEKIAEQKYKQDVQALTEQLASAKAELEQRAGPGGPVASAKSRPAALLAGIVMDNSQAKLEGTWQSSTYSPHFVDADYLHDQNQGKGSKSAVFSPRIQRGGTYEVRFSYSPGGNRASNVPVTIDHQDGRQTVQVNQLLDPPIDGLFVSLGSFRFEADSQASITISTQGTDGHVIVDAVQLLTPDDLGDPSGGTPSADGTPAASAVEDESLRTAELRLRQLEAQLKQLKQNVPPPAAMAMSVRDESQPSDGHIHIRGGVRNLGPVVPRGFLRVAMDMDVPPPQIPQDQSGRLQLARWIASRDNPLTARVYVNRVWRHLFGRGLVETPDNHGKMGRPPTHPELLDYLAERLVADGWSTKKLIRHIMLSHVYRLSARHDPRAAAVDDRNLLLWRASRRRLDAEVIRDNMLSFSGRLDTTAGGLTIRQITQYDLGYEFDTVRRSVYVPALRNTVLDLFEVFDQANPNLVVGDRNTSTLPTQALFLMNSPLVLEQSRHAARRLLGEPGLDDQQRLVLAYRRALGRPPTPREESLTLAYLAEYRADNARADERLEAWASVCHSLISCLDFRFVQ